MVKKLVLLCMWSIDYKSIYSVENMDYTWYVIVLKVLFCKGLRRGEKKTSLVPQRLLSFFAMMCCLFLMLVTHAWYDHGETRSLSPYISCFIPVEVLKNVF